ncbi:MAG: acyl-CoA dehydrogenase [Deltaproteobacteria bacterium]|nr:MAG: acyl-CoA dehydrogenase [Deltaproteobacteria bacterium]
MQIYKAPVKDMRFQLEAFGYDQVQKLEPFASYDLDTVEALLQGAASFATDVLLPINRSGDEEGLKWEPETGAVTTPKGFKEAYGKMVENGFVGICGPEEFGGAGAPTVVGVCMSEMWTAGCKSLSMCPGLTTGLVEALVAHATQEQKETYLPKLVTGEWGGTMCLTEPQAGTDLGILRTKAVPFEDHYKVTGSKIWITFAEQDFTDNIVHFVLGRLPDAPAGIKGISAFVVPKKTLDAKNNGVICSGLEHKMGIHASPTCAVEFEDSEGWLIGEPHKGMRSMFTMMNGARLFVGMEGVALSEIAYQTALEFAKERRQSRSLDPAKRDKEAAADCILVHPDVRRLLLNVRSTTEGMRGLGTWAALQLDLAHHHSDEKVREEADDLMGLLTPVIKSYFTDRGFLNISDAMQVCGGAGYITDWSIEQYLRDERIAPIYEGTNHVQALDLVGRKLPRHGGRALQVFGKNVAMLIQRCAAEEKMAEFTEPLGKSLEMVMGVTAELAGKGMADPEEAAAVASNYLDLFALTALAYSWTVQAEHAMKNAGPLSDTKVKLARYFFASILPEQRSLAKIIRAGKQHIMAFDVEEL